MTIRYNDQQLDAIKKCVEWYFCESYKNNLFVIGGLAGCGKTTIVNVIIKMLGLPNYNVLFSTLTGKASLVLRLKGNPANTIHKTFYSTYKNGGSSFKFKLKQKISPMIKLIVVDEMSMVNQKMLNDILSFGVPVIGLMDPGQVEPIIGSNIFMDDPSHLDVFLTQVMRQSDESGILDLAMMAREGRPIPYGKYKRSEVTTFDKVIDKITEFDVVLCWRNATRRRLNALIRHKKGFTSKYPMKGEKIVCLRNNYNYELEFNDIPIYIINGLQGITTSDSYITDDNDIPIVNIDFTPDFLINMVGEDYGFNAKGFKEIFDNYHINIDKDPFIESLMNDNENNEGIEDIAMLDYGYALTVTKSQGSEFNNVLVLASDYRTDDYENNSFKRYMYTGITRSKERVTVAYYE